jgi:hypothetical protein
VLLAVQRRTALLTTPKIVARAREKFDISALPEDALNEINRIQTRQRLNVVGKHASLVSPHKVDKYGSQPTTGAVRA